MHVRREGPITAATITSVRGTASRPRIAPEMPDFDIIGFLVQCRFSTLDLVRKNFMSIRVSLRSYDECVRSSVSAPAPAPARDGEVPKVASVWPLAWLGSKVVWARETIPREFFFAALPASQPYAKQAVRI